MILSQDYFSESHSQIFFSLVFERKGNLLKPLLSYKSENTWSRKCHTDRFLFVSLQDLPSQKPHSVRESLKEMEKHGALASVTENRIAPI